MALIQKSIVLKVKTHDMHTAGEPVRIIKSGMPSPEGNTILSKRKYLEDNLDHYRKLLMNEPRGHKDMYGALLFQDKPPCPEFDVLFINNEGYSPMCGHATIALGRYVVDFRMVEPSSPETEVIFNCPCGPVKTFVEYADSRSGRVRFESVPAFAYKTDVVLEVAGLGCITFDIAFGGAFYVIVNEKQLAVDLQNTPLQQMVDAASKLTDAVKKEILIVHPEHEELSSLYGTIITDGKDKFSDGPTTNLCIFADKQVDRSPTGSGVTARIALNVSKGLMSLNQEKEFRSIIGTSFIGKAVRETVGEQPSVVVEVSGNAYHVGDNIFYLESDDPLTTGFQLPR